MKTGNSKAAFTLTECLMYILVLSMTLVLAYAAAFRCFKNERDLRRNADDIAHSLHVGEQWRADVRAAVATPQLVDGEFRIPQGATQVVYTLAAGTVWRKIGSGAPLGVLRKVKSSRMEPGQRHHLTAWRWELELDSEQKVARVLPLFTFEAAGVAQP
jgi:hypothetical protein